MIDSLIYTLIYTYIHTRVDKYNFIKNTKGGDTDIHKNEREEKKTTKKRREEKTTDIHKNE